MKCLLCWIIGVALMIGGVIAEIAWLGVCFGTVIIGVLLLFFAPGILLAPLLFCISIGTAFIAAGCEKN